MATDTDNIADLKAKWDKAMLKLADNEAAYRRFEETIWRPAYEREKTFEEDYGLVGLAKFQQHDRAMALHSAHPGHIIPAEINTALDILSEAASDAETDLMKMEAPDLAALKWKLDRVLRIDDSNAEDGGCTPCWTARYVQQTILDCARLLKD